MAKKKHWSYVESRKHWVGHFHHKKKTNRRAARRVIATHAECPEENYEFLMARWRTVAFDLEVDYTSDAPLRLGVALEEWLEYVKRYRDIKTMKLYRRTASRLFESMGNILVNQVNLSHTDKFATMLTRKYRVSDQTKVSICKEAKAFFSFLVDREVLDKKPRFPDIQCTKKEMRAYTPEQLFLIRQRINFMVQRSKGSNVFLRAQLRVITMAMHTGMRGGEIRNLLINNISIEKRCIYLRDNENWRIKGRREDKPIPINDALLEFLVLDLRHRSPSEVWYLDNGKGRKTYSYACDMAKAIRAHGIAIGMNPAEMPKPIHGIRSCVATMMSEKGRDIVSIQKLLRHKDINTTRNYINTEKRDLKSSVDVLEYTG